MYIDIDIDSGRFFIPKGASLLEARSTDDLRRSADTQGGLASREQTNTACRITRPVLFLFLARPHIISGPSFLSATVLSDLSRPLPGRLHNDFQTTDYKQCKPVETTQNRS